MQCFILQEMWGILHFVCAVLGVCKVLKKRGKVRKMCVSCWKALTKVFNLCKSNLYDYLIKLLSDVLHSWKNSHYTLESVYTMKWISGLRRTCIFYDGRICMRAEFRKWSDLIGHCILNLAAFLVILVAFLPHTSINFWSWFLFNSCDNAVEYYTIRLM